MNQAVRLANDAHLRSPSLQSFIGSRCRLDDWRSLPIFLAGGILGVPAGAYLLLHLQTSVYRDIIGGLLIGYGGDLLLRLEIRPPRTGPLCDACAGFWGGFTGGLTGFRGAFVTIWCGLKGWNKMRRRGVYQPFILGMRPVTLRAIYLMRPSSITSAQSDFLAPAFVPAALLGAWLGLRVFKRLSDRQFDLAVNALLIVSGIGLIL
ncbi:MAG TPA: TSUP family transporter [Acetobacteraceae bacterium]|nr:TSUP family transporter [Acetobacteraceae bacterium]